MGDKFYDSEAPFNMAVATLMRLDTILQQIRTTDYCFPFDCAEKQKSYLGLVKQFYINAIPLLDDTIAKKYSYVLELDIPNRAKIRSGNQKLISYYSPELNLKLNKILIQLQQHLRKYFMPKGRDLRRAVANIG